MACIVVLFLATPALAEFHLDYLATFTPPHNEAIVGYDRKVGGLVERYRMELNPTFQYKKLELSFMVRAQGTNKWQKPADVGHGFSEWGESDWNVDKWKYSYTAKGIYRFTPMFGAYIRQYSPIGDWEGHGNETHYDVQVGLTGRLF